ncbi:MAG: DUF4160 domain-containing protein [bacterium]
MEKVMPEISRFYGIIIAMYFDEHGPPHFHVRYAGSKAAVRIQDLTISEGSLPPRVLGLVVEWAAKHQKELMYNWELVQSDQQPSKIQPLD